jgi:hypothetical protein
MSAHENVASQLEMAGLDDLRRRVELATNLAVRSRLRRQVETTYELLTELPTAEDLSFLHSGLCQTCLPHSRPSENHTPWRRESGRFTLLVTPGVMDGGRVVNKLQSKGRLAPPREPEAAYYVGVPYGTKARLIMIHLQTEGMRSRLVSLGPSLSSFLRSLGLDVRGGPRGTITPVREQCLRIARCTFTLQWSGVSESGDTRTIISDTKIVEGLDLWNANREDWSGEVELSARFHEHLREHAVPLDKRALSMLSGNSLGLDLYSLFAYRLPRLAHDLHLSWSQLQGQIGTEYSAGCLLARKVREVMPLVKSAYPHANVDVTRHGITMRQSKPAVPKTTVQGLRLIDAPASHG